MAAKTPKTTNAEQLDDRVKYWWVVLVQGIAIILIGWLLLRNPAITTITLVTLMGLYLLIAGIVDVVASLFEITKEGSK